MAEMTDAKKRKKTTMSGEEFVSNLQKIGITPTYLAEQSGRHKTVGHFWAKERIRIPKSLREWVLRAVAFREENPIPRADD